MHVEEYETVKLLLDFFVALFVVGNSILHTYRFELESILLLFCIGHMF